jgi:hypothetical protein
MTVFDEATAVTRRSEGIYDTAADPRFALIAPGGATPPAVNGGALLATVLRAVLDGSPHPYPVATNASFLRVPQLAPAEVQVSWLKRGRTAATARATLIQDGQPVLDTTVTTGTLPAAPAASAGCLAAGSSAGGSPADGADHGEGAEGAGSGASPGLEWTGVRPAFPDLADCIDLGQWPGAVAADGSAGFPAHVEVLLDPACTGWRSNAATCSCAITAIRMRSCWRSR